MSITRQDTHVLGYASLWLDAFANVGVSERDMWLPGTYIPTSCTYSFVICWPSRTEAVLTLNHRSGSSTTCGCSVTRPPEGLFSHFVRGS